MEIGKTGWKTISKFNKHGGGQILGYEAPASEALLRQLQESGVYIEVVGNKSSRWIMPNNTDPQVLRGKKFRIFTENQTYHSFEKMLEKQLGSPLSENRFDDLVDWTVQNAWHKTGVNQTRGYFLDLDNLSNGKKAELKKILEQNGGKLNRQDNTISVTDPEWVETLEFLWKCADRQRDLRANGKSPTPLEFKKTAEKSTGSLMEKLATIKTKKQPLVFSYHTKTSKVQGT